MLTDAKSPPAELLDGKTQREQDLIKENWVSIKNHSRGSRAQSVYNLKLLGDDDVDSLLADIFSAQTSAFKINASVGIFLRNTNTNELRYFHGVKYDHRLFRSPFLVRNREEFRIFTDALKEADFTENPMSSIDDSQWGFAGATNLSVYVDHLDFPISVRRRRKRGALKVGTSRGPCFFYCLAAHKNPEKVKKYVTRKNKGVMRLENEMKSYYYQYAQLPLKYFDGVALSDIDELERTFNLGIQIYTYDTNLKTARLKRRANPNYNDVMHLDLTEEMEETPFFRFIHDMKVYSPYVQCNKCSQIRGHDATDCCTPFSSAWSKSTSLSARTASSSAWSKLTSLSARTASSSAWSKSTSLSARTASKSAV